MKQMTLRASFLLLVIGLSWADGQTTTVLGGVTFVNSTGGRRVGLQIRFNQPLNATQFFEIQGPLCNDSVLVQLVGEDTVRVFPNPASSGCAANEFASNARVPNGVGASLRFFGTSESALDILHAAWFDGNPNNPTLTHTVQVVAPINNTGLDANQAVVTIYDSLNNPLTAQSVQPGEGWPTTLCGLVVSGEGTPQITLNLAPTPGVVCCVPPLAGMGPVQFTVSGGSPIAKTRIRWQMSGAKIGSSVEVFAVNDHAADTTVSDAVALNFKTTLPVNRFGPADFRPFTQVVGAATARLQLCGATIVSGSSTASSRYVLGNLSTTPPDIDIEQMDWVRPAGGGPPEHLFYLFEEGSGATATLNAAAAAFSRVVGSPLGLGNGQFGKAFLGGGPAPNRVLTGFAPPVGSGDWTVSFWIDQRGVVGLPAPAPAFGVFGGGPLALRCLLDDPGPGVATISGLGMGVPPVSMLVEPGALPVARARPRVITWVHDGTSGTVTGYVDGSFVSSGPRTVSLLSGPLALGAHGAAGLPDAARLDEFRFYARALSAGEVSLTWNTPLSGPASQSQWQMNQAGAGLDVNGVSGTPYCPADTRIDYNAMFTVNLSSANPGMGWELFFGSGFSLPRINGALPLPDDQLFNDDPALAIPLNGFAFPPFAPISFSGSSPAEATLHAQLVLFDPSTPTGLALSQASILRVRDLSTKVTVEALGPSALNTITTSGFWRVTHHGNGPPITGVTLGWRNTTTPGLAMAAFDVDAPGLAGNFVYGNGTAPCAGTFRNGSDVTTGLHYDPWNSFTSVPGPSCTGGNCGFIATHPLDPSDSTFQSLLFRFALQLFTATTFEFDCAVSGTPGSSGGSMAGLVVVVHLAGGRTLVGELEADPQDPNRAFIELK